MRSGDAWLLVVWCVKRVRLGLWEGKFHLHIGVAHREDDDVSPLVLSVLILRERILTRCVVLMQLPRRKGVAVPSCRRLQALVVVEDIARRWRAHRDGFL